MTVTVIQQLTEADERFGSRLSITSSGCIEFVGAKNGGGYGHLWHEGKCIDAHRLAWRLIGNELIPGLVLDHVCRNRACCNPLHLRQVTQRENILVSNSPSAIHARKTECPAGHSLTDAANVYVWRGQRRCRACNTEKQRTYKARKRLRT